MQSRKTGPHRDQGRNRLTDVHGTVVEDICSGRIMELLEPWRELVMPTPFDDKIARYGRHWQRPWLVFGTLSFIVAMSMFFLQPATHRNTKVAKIEEGDSFAVIASIRRAPRAIVFLDANWSTNTSEGRKYFKEAATQLMSEFPSIEFFVLDEWPLENGKENQRQHTQAWLASLDLKELDVGRGCAIGRGDVIWLESNRVVGEEWSARVAKTSGIVKRTKALWR